MTMDEQTYETESTRVALALAHANWIAMNADTSAHLFAMAPNILLRFEQWEQGSLSMRAIADASAYWVARRCIGILMAEFTFTLPAAFNALAVACASDERAIATALHDDTDRPAKRVMPLLEAILERTPNVEQAIPTRRDVMSMQ